MDLSYKKIVTVEKMARLARVYQKSGKVVGCMSGSFDVVTGKHFKCFYEYSRHCDVLFALVNSDQSVRAYKGKGRPLVHETERSYVLAQSPYITHVAVFDEITPVDALAKIKPNIFLNSSEWGSGSIEKNVIEKNGGKIMCLDVIPPEEWTVSSSALMARIIKSEQNQARRAIFLDRDGVINENGDGYISDWSKFKFNPQVISSLKRLTKAGFPLFIVTNQSGIGRGFYTEAKMHKLHAQLKAYLKERGITIDGIYYCPHHPDDTCVCRKPAPGLLLQAGREHNLNLSKSWFIGDSDADVGAGRQSNTPTILIAPKVSGVYEPNYLVPDFKAAVDIILNA